MKKLIGQNLQNLRKKFKYSQKQLAGILDIPRPSISQIELGKREINASELVTLLEIFNISLSDLIKSPISERKAKGEKQLYFLRHGEAMDDLYNQYGGWADPDLSARGVNKAFLVAQNLQRKGIKPEMIYTSPLKRAKTKARIIGRELEANVKITQFLKERNTYGLLCGVNKDLAKKKFPELVEAYENGKFVLGSERYEDFVDRLDLLVNFLREISYKTVVCVTHGKLLTAIIKEFLRMKPEELEDGCLLHIGFDNKGLYYIESEGIRFTRSI